MNNLFQGVIAIFTVTLAAACLPQRQYDSKEGVKDCRPYYEYLKENFKEVKEGIFDFTGTPQYDTTLPVEYQHINKPCLIGLKKKQVERIFGLPSLRQHSRYHYYFREKCFQEGENRPGCSGLIFYFDWEGRVEKVHLPSLEIPPKQ